MYSTSPLTVAAYTADPWQSSLPVLRYRSPAAYAGLNVLRGNQGPDIDVSQILKADLVLIQRDFPRFAKAYGEIMDIAQQLKKPVIYEIDDLLMALPTEHLSHKDISDVLLPIFLAIMEADAVTTSTKTLHDYLKVFNPNTHILPNYLDDQIWHPRPVPERSTRDHPVVIGYMGGLTHINDLISILPVLTEIISKYPTQSRLKFWGVRPPQALLNYPAVEWIPIDILDYAEFANYFSQQECDVFIAPLEDNGFNHAKSAIKFFEYSVLGVPGVFSPIPAYQEVILNGQNGFLASDHQTWINSLSKLIEDPELRQELGIAAQQTVIDNWFVSAHAVQWDELYRQVISSPRSTGPDRVKRIRIMADAALQIQSRHHELATQNNLLLEELAGTKDKAEHLQSRLDEIYQSRSWQMLHRFHMLRQWIIPPKSQREKFLQRISILSRRSNQTNK